MKLFVHSSILRRILPVAAIVCSFLFTPAGMHGQRYLGSIQGTVADPSGANIPDAEVTAEDTGTHFKTTVKANSSGVFNFAALNPGTYTVSVTAANFSPQTRTNVLITAGQLQTVDLQLKVSGSAETIEVQSTSNALLDSGSPNIATTLSQQEVTDLPNVGRNPYVLATLAVGVTNNGSGGYFQGKSSQFTNPFSGVAVQISSVGSSGHNRLTLNGIPNDPGERFSGASYAGFVPSPEAVQEVKVQTSFFDAQIGHGNGTVTNTVVRSGTNRLHGAAYYVFQNTYLNANTYERVPNQNLCYPGSPGCANRIAPTRRSNDQLSQTGFVIDGPVVIPKLYNGRNKTFFMAAFERYASHTALTYNSLVPTAAQRAGDFSGLCSAFNSAGLCTSGIQIYDPLSPVDAAGNRTVYFANNVIPAGRISAAGRSLLNYFPEANANVSSSVNYISNQTSYPSTYPSFIFRVDHALGQKNKLNAVIFRSGLTQNYPMQGFPKGIGPITPGSTNSGYGYHVYRNNRGGALDDIHQFSDTLVLDSRLGIVFHPFGLTYPGNQDFDLSSIGISSTNLPYQSFPGVSLSDNYAGLAGGAFGQVSSFANGSLEEILTKSLGRHSVRIGFEGNLFRYNVQAPQSGFGAISFDRYFTRRNYNTGDSSSGDPLAALLLGAYTTAPYNINPAYATQQLYLAPFVQDDWRVNDKLTVNLGFRWDYESPLTERYNKQVRYFDVNATSPISSAVGLPLKGGLVYTDNTERHAYATDLNNFQPRLGVVYQAMPGTILRAGYGIIYLNTIERPYSPGFTQQSGGGNNYTANTPLATLSNPYPNGVALPTGSSLGLATGIGTNVDFVDPTHTTPKSTQYTLNVQQQILGNLVFQISYVGNRVRQLEVDHDINVLPLQYYSTGTNPAANLANQTFLNTAVANPLAGRLPSGSNSNLTGATIARNLLLRPFPEFGSVTERFSPIGEANYDALQVQFSKPMRNHFSLQGSFTWNKQIVKNQFLNNVGSSSTLSRVVDPSASLIGNVFGTVELPRFLNRPFYERLVVGGWKLNSVMRAQNGSLIAAPTNVDQIGDPNVAPGTFQRMFNTCYQNQQGVNQSVSTPSCDGTSPTPAFRQRYSYTLQNNDPYIRVRQRIYPLVDASLFKQFIVREGTSFEIRGEFFNVFNRPNFGGPNTSLGNAAYGTVTLTQANDSRTGQLTARINF
jgi:hypothetical protein